MKRILAGLLVCAGSLAVWHLPPAAAAEPGTELGALNAEVQALKARQLAIQADLKAIHALLSGTPRAPAAAAAAPAPVGDSDTAALRQELEATKKIVDDYKAREEKARLARAPTRDIDMTLDVSEDPFKGSADAPVTLVEFTDYQCPFCGRHKKDVMPQLLKNYVETGKVRYVMRDFPLDFHKLSAKAHEAAHCAGAQGKYWEMNDQLFANQKALQPENLPKYAEAAGVTDMAAFQTCLDGDQYAERAKQSLAEGAQAGVTGTPSFVIGLTQPDATVKLKKFIRGAQAYPVFQKTIDELLTTAKG